jgi:glutathione S-transferase
MITLHAFGPHFGLPDPSPFCIKADLLLQLSGLPYRRASGDLRRAPKRKLPLIVDDGVTVPDSSFIRFHLETKHGIDFDKGLTPAQRGVSWALEKMLEDHLYWIIVHERWVDAANFARGPAQFFQSVPAPLRPFVIAMVKRKVAGNLDAQGIGRHSADERALLAGRALDAAAAILGDKPFLMGDEPSGGDAALGAFMIAGMCRLFESRVRGLIESHANLVAYEARMRARFYGEETGVRQAA